MAPAKRSTTQNRFQGDFPCEAEIARRLSQDPKDWSSKATILERDGLPRVDAVMGGRYWPSVKAFFLHRSGLTTVQVSQPDGEENLDAL